MEKELGYQLPKAMHKEYGKHINDLADSRQAELSSQDIHDAFHAEYILRDTPLKLDLKQANTSRNLAARDSSRLLRTPSAPPVLSVGRQLCFRLVVA
jgi:2-isopropylmalate synthase